jgi:hypothetical protein
LLKNIEFYILDKEKIYQLIKEETERMHLTFQPYNKGVNFGFLISNGEQDVYGSIHSNKMSKDIYQGISKISYNFYNSNGKKNFIILVDKKENHFLVIPFNVMKNDFFQDKVMIMFIMIIIYCVIHTGYKKAKLI